MSLPARICSSLLALTLLLGAACLSTPLALAAAGKPVVTRVGSGGGPLAPTTVVIHGKLLGGADAVKFGALKGKVLRKLGGTALEVRTPKGARPGPVSVRVHTSAGWSDAGTRSRYTFVRAPRVASLSLASGRYTGGQVVRLTGDDLARPRTVLFGNAKATIVKSSAHLIVVRTPVGVLGRTLVKVKTMGGTSRGIGFTYVRPPLEDKHTLTTTDGTFEAAQFDWVTGGYDPDSGQTLPWVVGLPAGVTAPSVGASFLIRPGNQAFPSGLAGTVDSVAVQSDESTRVTVLPTDLDTAIDRLTVDYSGPLPAQQGVSPRRSVETAIAFPIDASALFCHDQQGQSVAFGADFTMQVTDIDVSQHLEMGGLFSRPTYDGTFTSEVAVTGKFHGEAASTCSIRPEWQNAHRRVIPLGTSGATVSFAPAFEFSVSGKGTLTLLNRTRTTYGLNATLGDAPRFSRTSRTVESKIGGALSFEVGLAGGVSVQFGLLDRAGVEGKLMLGVTAGVEAADHNVCVTGKLVMKISVEALPRRHHQALGVSGARGQHRPLPVCPRLHARGDLAALDDRAAGHLRPPPRRRAGPGVRGDAADG